MQRQGAAAGTQVSPAQIRQTRTQNGHERVCAVSVLCAVCCVMCDVVAYAARIKAAEGECKMLTVIELARGGEGSIFEQEVKAPRHYCGSCMCVCDWECVMCWCG